MNEPLSEQQLSNILSLLSAIANTIAKGMVPDQQRLEALLPAYAGGGVDQILQELELWADILQRVRTGVLSEVSAIQLLQDRDIPEAPAVLAVNAVVEPPPLPSPPPPSPSAIQLLQEIVKQEFKGIIQNLRLVEALWAALGLEVPYEQYHQWLPDHRWHADIDWYHLPPWMKRNERLMESLLIRRQPVTARYVSYTVVDNNLMRKLHDNVPVHEPIERPRENHHRRLRDNAWHNDLDWEHLPLWIKDSPKLVNDLRRGQQVEGRTFSYKMVQNRLMRRLKRRGSAVESRKRY